MIECYGSLTRVWINQPKIPRQLLQLPFFRLFRACLEQLLECNEHFPTLEHTFVTLLNLGDFDFILSKYSNKDKHHQLNQKKRHLINLAGLISSAVTGYHHLHGRTPQSGSNVSGQDFKRTCRGLAEFLVPTVQSGPGKRGGAGGGRGDLGGGGDGLPTSLSAPETRFGH